MTPLVSMLGIPAEAEIDVINDDNAESYWERSDQFDMAIDLTAGRAGLVALAEAMRRWIVHVLGVDVTIEPLTEMREVNLAWYVGLDADATKIGDHVVERRGDRRGDHVAGDRAVRTDLPRSIGRARQGQGRAGLSDPGDDAGQDHPHEAAEPGDRLADPASGGGRMSGPLASIPVGVVVERSKSATPWGEFYWRAVSVLPGQPDTAPWTKLSDDGERATFYAGTAEVELYRTETGFYRDNLNQARPPLGRVAFGRSRSALIVVSAVTPIRRKAKA